MSTLTNSELDQIWAEADSEDNHKILRLVAEIDMLRKSYGAIERRYRLLRKGLAALAISSRKKAFHQGQGFMRGKISHLLKENGHVLASELALVAHIDYDTDIVGKYVPQKPDHSSVG